jgi:hypothetical protein
VSERVRYDRKRGRVEVGLEKDLLERRDIGPAQRAALRAQAHAVDLAEAARDPDLLSTAGRVYLDLLAAAGLSAGGAKPVDAFDSLLAELGRAGAGTGNPPNT